MKSKQKKLQVKFSKQLEAFFDGSCLPKNPNGYGTYGFIVYKGNKVIASTGAFIGKGEGITNNVAEYRGILACLSWLKRNKPKRKVTIKGDSKLVINQLKGEWNVKAENLSEFFHTADELLNSLDVELKHIPREKNEEANRIAINVYKNVKDKI